MRPSKWPQKPKKKGPSPRLPGHEGGLHTDTTTSGCGLSIMPDGFVGMAEPWPEVRGSPRVTGRTVGRAAWWRKPSRKHTTPTSYSISERRTRAQLAFSHAACGETQDIHHGRLKRCQHPANKQLLRQPDRLGSRAQVERHWPHASTGTDRTITLEGYARGVNESQPDSGPACLRPRCFLAYRQSPRKSP